MFRYHEVLFRKHLKASFSVNCEAFSQYASFRENNHQMELNALLF